MIVLRGRFSEGQNFSNHLCRGLIVVGQPYPPIKEKLRLKKKRMSKEQWDRYYFRICKEVVEQCIGRGRRHINDYCLVVLCDRRYTQDRWQFGPNHNTH